MISLQIAMQSSRLTPLSIDAMISALSILPLAVGAGAVVSIAVGVKTGVGLVVGIGAGLLSAVAASPPTFGRCQPSIGNIRRVATARKSANV